MPASVFLGTAAPTVTVQDECANIVLASVRTHGYSRSLEDATIRHIEALESIFGTMSTKQYQAFASCFAFDLALAGTCRTESCNLGV